MVSLYKLLKQFKTHSNLVESKQVLEDALQVASQSGQTTTGQQGPQAPELYYLEQHFRIDSGAHHLHRACKRASDGGTQYIAKYFKLMTPEDEFLKNKLAHCLEYYKDLPPHPNIMKAREMVDKVASKHSGIFLISEYHERGNLTQFCQDAENKYFNVLTLLAEVAEALAHMHKHDRPHGAIRGNNVLISKDSHAIVHDFECMRFFMDHSDHPWMPPHQYEIHYKVAWHRNEFDVRWYAPEIVVPDVLEEDPATEVFRVHQTRAGDVWSFGALILELYSEMRPYNNWRRPSAVVMCLTERELPPMPEEWNVLWMSRELFDFMKELLVIKPEDRPTMDYVAERMRQFEKAYVPKVPKRRAS
ncbi:kinase-like domain-containing protein [Irpex rosettiformis]|uniref:Kinase-like domain-containing protein n=1 Tax=Irpex rosettiformis TaxID=378272 RepID=A0ACB8TTX1_9APHY|nr:kinase-like domain-containing protein [Irpex rosettiformis]